MTGPQLEARKPRLLVVASTYPRWAGDHEPGFVHGLVRGLLPVFDVLVVCPHAPGAAASEILDGAEIRRYRYAPPRFETLVNDGGILANLRRSRWKWLLVPGFLASQLVMVWRLRRRWKPDAMHAHWLLPQGLVTAIALAFPRARTPLLVTSHGTDLHALRAPVLVALKRFAARRASAITVVSAAMQGELERIGVEDAKASVLPMGVDLAERFTPDARVERAGDELLFVGRMTETKGLRHLVAAMPAILAAHPSVRLTVVGHGPELEACKARAIALGIADHVLFEGALPQAALPGYYRRAAVFVAPFEEAPSGAREGLGLVMVEAVGCGCPVVTTRQPATADVFGETGPAGLAEPGSAQSLASEIIRTLDDPMAARRKTADARAHVVERFGMEGVAARYAALLAALMGAVAPEPRA
jgi:glycosyltransferase involved in cell wall biosynthesis